MKKIDLDDKLKKNSKKINSNKAKYTGFQKRFNVLPAKVKLVSTKGLTKDLINKYSILNGAKYVSFGGYQIIKVCVK